MTRARRRRRRIWIAALCCVPTLAILVAWLIAATTSVPAPGRALPESSAVGLAENQFQVYSASGAINFEDLLPQYRPPTPVSGTGAWGRQFTDSGKVAGVIGVRRGVEWHGRFATHFTLVGVPLWLPLLCTAPLLAVAGRQVRRLRESARRRREGACVYCGVELPAGAERCPSCGHAQPEVDPVSAALLGSAPAVTPPHQQPNASAPPAVGPANGGILPPP
jgi:hypothetical protein